MDNYLGQEDRRQYPDKITELELTPYHADDYLSNDKYHSFLKGCDCEVKIIRGDKKSNLLINKYCKTHKVMCSKTGWELGWYGGTKFESKKELTDDEVREIRKRFKQGFTVRQLMSKFKKTYWEIYGVTSNSRYKDVV